MTPYIAGWIGLAIAVSILASSKYWIGIDKLNDVLFLVIGATYVYGMAQLFEDITRWWQS